MLFDKRLASPRAADCGGLQGVAFANVSLQSLLIVQAVVRAQRWDGAWVVCVASSVALVSVQHLLEVGAGRLSPGLGVAVSVFQVLLAFCCAIVFVVDIAMGLDSKARLTIQLIKHVLDNVHYVWAYSSAHFGGWLLELAGVLAILAVFAVWEVFRRVGTSAFFVGRSTTRCAATLAGVGALASSVPLTLCTLPFYAGDQQGTLAGDALAAGLWLVTKDPVASAASSEHAVVSAASGLSEKPSVPHLLYFHLEAARGDMVTKRTMPTVTRLFESGEGSIHKLLATQPMTLKSAWEALCGTVPAIYADFREHQNEELKAWCLPRVLRSLGYATVCAKTNEFLSDLPRDVFGFDEVLSAKDPVRLMGLVDEWVQARQKESKPVFIYFFYTGSHEPYTLERLDGEDQFPVSVQNFHPQETWNIYHNMQHRGDLCAGDLLALLEARGINSTNSARFLFGDHGETLPGESIHVQGSRMAPHGSSVDLDQIRTFVLAAFPSAEAHGRRSLRDDGRVLLPPAPRRFGDLYASVLDLVGLAAQGPLFMGLSLRKPSPADRVVFSYGWYDTVRCALRTQNGTRFSLSGAAHDTLADSEERTALIMPTVQTEQARTSCFQHLYFVNSFYHYTIPGVWIFNPVQPAHFQDKRRSRGAEL